MRHAVQASGIQDTYLAGMWKGDLIKGLLWARRNECSLWRTLDYRAPSWCWSAFDADVFYHWAFLLRTMESRYTIRHATMLRENTSPADCTAGGYLHVTGRLEQVDSVQLEEPDENSVMFDDGITGS